MKAISSSPMISNLSNRGHGSSGEVFLYYVRQLEIKTSLVLILVFEGFMDTFCNGFAMEDEPLCDRRLQRTECVTYLKLENNEKISVFNDFYFDFRVWLTMLGS